MSYFKYFPKTFYNFGNETTDTYVQNITLYADVVDQIRDSVNFYTKYYIKNNERPDQLSFKLYDTPSYYWTFFILNDNIRERGWPLSNTEVLEKVQRDHPSSTITTRTTLYDRFKVGQTITGTVTGATATIDHRHLDLGQLVLSNVSGTFQNGELISSINEEETVETITLQSMAMEYQSARYYINGDEEVVDIDPTVGPGALLTEVTYEDYYIAQNDELKEINVIKPESINEIVESFREALSF